MRRFVLCITSLALICTIVPGSRGADDATAILEKAAKAHFPKGVDTKNQGTISKTKGVLHIMGMDLDFVQETTVQLPNKFKDVMELTVGGNTVKVVSVYNGKDAWIRAGGQDVTITKEIKAEFEDAAYTVQLMHGAFLKDKGVKLSQLGEVKVKDKPAVGITVSREGKKDINLYFSKETGLVVKVELRKIDNNTGQEVNEERFILEYQDAADRKVAKKVEILRDGKPFLEAEVLEVKVVEKVDDGEFVQPK